MKLVQRSHVLIIASFVLLAAGIWGVRLLLSNANAEVLKPASYSHNDNLIDPTTGSVDGSGVMDFDTGGDRSTFSIAYLNDEEGSSSQILFYNFASPAGGDSSFRLGVVYSFLKSKGDDGFSIEYSTAGNSSCSDASSRTWVPLVTATQETGKFEADATLENVMASQVCVKIDRVLNNDLDAAGYKFRDSNGLKLYDIWMETAEADIDVNVSTAPGPYPVGDLVTYRLEAVNNGAGDADDVDVQFRIPEELSYYKSRPSLGIYDPIAGVWEIGSLADGRSASLEVTLQVLEKPPRENIVMNAAVKYHDVLKDVERSGAKSVRIEIGDAVEEFSILEPYVEPPPVQQPEEIINDVQAQQSEPQICSLDCDRTSFFLYIVNPDGTTRDTLSDFARVTRYEDRLFHVSFEDKGSDFDFNDIAFDLDLRDCRAAQVTMTDLNAGWHHQVRSNIYYDGILQQGIVLWPDSHEGAGETLTFDLNDYVSSEYLTCSE